MLHACIFLLLFIVPLRTAWGLEWLLLYLSLHVWQNNLCKQEHW